MHRFRITAVLGTLLLICVTSAIGQQSVRCESNDGRRRYCGTYRPDQVTFQRQVSGSACTRNQTWGVDRQGLWVDRGCRAIFTIINGYPGRPGQGGRPGWTHPGPGNPWPPNGNWNGGNWGRGGACFYTEANFGGDYFCMRRGESRPSLSGYGDRISSVRIFGGARVTVFNDRDYRNGQDTTGRDIADLRNWRMSSRPSNTWNNRISSVQVR